jgi:Zn-finger nucleic acid-binding protein
MKMMKTATKTSQDFISTQKINVWIQACPHCAQVWVIGDVAEGEKYRCKDCTHEFHIGNEHFPAQLTATKTK